VWNLLKELNAQGRLTSTQAVLCAPTMPPEELYDLERDPHEIDNLAGSPKHREILERLRAALEDWIPKTDDKGGIMEPPDVVRRKGLTRPWEIPTQRPSVMQESNQFAVSAGGSQCQCAVPVQCSVG